MKTCIEPKRFCTALILVIGLIGSAISTGIGPTLAAAGTDTIASRCCGTSSNGRCCTMACCQTPAPQSERTSFDSERGRSRIENDYLRETRSFHAASGIAKGSNRLAIYVVDDHVTNHSLQLAHVRLQI